MPRMSPCNSPNLPVKKPNGKGWRFAQDIGAINKEILQFQTHIPHYQIFPRVLPRYFPVIDRRGAFFQHSCKTQDRKYLFAFLPGKIRVYVDSRAPG